MPNSFFNKIILRSPGLGGDFTFYDQDFVFGSLQETSALALISDNLSIDELTFTVRGRVPEGAGQGPSNVPYEYLYDENDELILDENDEPIEVSVLSYLGVDFSQCASYSDIVLVYHGDELLGKYYVESVKRVGRNGGFAFTCVSMMGVLDQREHAGGIYVSELAGDIIADIMGDLPYSIDAVLANTALTGWLPYAQRSTNHISARDNLEQVLFACGASVMRDANMDLEFSYNLPQTMTSFSLYGQVYAGSSRDNLAPVTLVKLTEHSFFASGSVPDTVLYEDSGGTVLDHYKIIFDGPYHTLTWTGASIDESGANYAVLSGSGVLTGKPYVHVQRVRNKSTGAAGETKEIAITAATLVSAINSDSALDRLASFYAQEQEISAEILTNLERPGSLIELPDPNDWSQTVSGYVKSMDRSYSTTVKSKVKLTQGWHPGNVGNSFDSSLIVRKSDVAGGTWNVPAELQGKKALVVLFGGAQGGQGGWYGSGGERNDGSGPNSATAYTCKTYRSSEAPVMGGLGPLGHGLDGGPGGQGGGIGKMLALNIASLAASYSVAMGTGGSGGTGGTVSRTISTSNVITLTKVDPTDGSYGTDSTFDSYSTSAGTLVDGSYVDLTDGTVIAGKGQQGTKGGKGGDGGVSIAGFKDNNSTYDYSVAGRGKAGEGVGTYSGGSPADGLVGDNMRGYFNPGYDHVGLQGGGGGGGAALGNNGGAGSNNAQKHQYTSGDDTYMAMGRMYHGTAYDASKGGNGANATVVPSQSDLYGGTGGAGGGGGGGNGQPVGWAHWTSEVYGIGLEGVGGNGSAGGQGSDGWFIVYYKA